MATVQVLELPNDKFVIVFGEILAENFAPDAVQQLKAETGAVSVLAFEGPIEVRR